MSGPSRRWGSMDDAVVECGGGISKKTVRRMITRGEIYAERIGARHIRVDLDSIHGQPLQFMGGDAD